MSQADVEMVRRTIGVFNRRELDALAASSEEDLEIVSALTAANLGDSTYRGRSDAWHRYFEAMDASWENWRIEDFELLDAGEDRVACLCRLLGTGRQSRVPVERAVGIVFRLRDGRLWRIRSYLEPGDALAAVGLSA